MKKDIKFLILFLIAATNSLAQENYKTEINETSLNFSEKNTYEVTLYDVNKKNNRPKNIILMIGDGMGVSHISAALKANNNQLYMQNFNIAGLLKTYSSDNYITDSAAGGTAIACGVKTFNGAIGLNNDSIAVETILEFAEKMDKATGLVSTSAITHATPASFIAHQLSRKMYEEIAADFLKTDIDLFVGGGYSHFAKRKDGKNLVADLQNKGYNICRSIDELQKVTTGKVAALTSDEHNERINKRGNYLPKATAKALDLLKQNDNGFFLMVEGSQIDWGGHQNNINYVVEETLDFDKAVGEALKFAAHNGETLVIVTADHETGGLAITGGKVSETEFDVEFASRKHTACMVPVLAIGPGDLLFGGIYENTDLFHKIKSLMQTQE